MVLTSDQNFRPGPGFASASNLEAALDLCFDLANELGAHEIMVAGGGAVYAELLPRATTLLLTEVELAPEGDTQFPEFDRRLWKEVGRTELIQTPGDVASYRFVTLRRS